MKIIKKPLFWHRMIDPINKGKRFIKKKKKHSKIKKLLFQDSHKKR